MINFLLIADSNYNLQLVNAINSLEENFNLETEGSTIYVIHKNPKSFEKYFKFVNYKKIKIIKFDKKYRVLNNIKNSHLSEVTYYRLYIDKLLGLENGYLVYFDADLFFINNSTEIIQNAVRELKNSNKLIAAVKENIITENNLEYFKKLGIENIPYFNAGLIVFNLNICLQENLFERLRVKLSEIDFKLMYWDQDILNLLLKGEFLQLDYKINLGIDLTSKNKIPEKVFAIHYKGKNKPWDSKYAFRDEAELYQKIHYRSFGTYHLTNIRSNFKIVLTKIKFFKLLKILKIQSLKWL